MRTLLAVDVSNVLHELDWDKLARKIERCCNAILRCASAYSFVTSWLALRAELEVEHEARANARDVDAARVVLEKRKRTCTARHCDAHAVSVRRAHRRSLRPISFAMSCQNVGLCAHKGNVCPLGFLQRSPRVRKGSVIRCPLHVLVTACTNVTCTHNRVRLSQCTNRGSSCTTFVHGAIRRVSRRAFQRTRRTPI